MTLQSSKGFSLADVLIIVVVVGALGGVGSTVYQRQKTEPKPESPKITNFEECAAAGNPIMESYPEQCAANGQTFVRDVVEEYKRTTTVPRDWKKFTNADYNLSFFYPVELVVSFDSIDKNDGEQNVFSKNATTVGQFCIKEQVDSQSCIGQINAFDQVIEETVKQYQGYLERNDAEVTVSNFMVEGKNASRVVATYPDEIVTTYFVGFNDNTYVFPEIRENSELSQDAALAIFESAKFE